MHKLIEKQIPCQMKKPSSALFLSQSYQDAWEDYMRSINITYLYSHKLPNLTLFNRHTYPDYPYMISRVSDDRYVLEMENEDSVGMGVFIDIYPYDRLGKTKEEAVSFGLKGDRLSSLCYQATRKHFAIETTTSLLRKIVKYPVFLVSKMIGKDYFPEQVGEVGRSEGLR